MATAQDIITRALKRLSILRVGGTPSGAQSVDALSSLNSMIDSWTARGVAVNPNLPIPAQHEPAFVDLLAIRLAADYGVTPSPLLIQEAKDGWFSLQAAYITAPVADFDSALKYLPTSRRFFGSIVTSSGARASGFITLAANTTQTIKNDANCTITNPTTGLPTQITFEPQTPNAIAATGTTSAIPGNAQFTVNHLSNIQTDRIFLYTIY